MRTKQVLNDLKEALKQEYLYTTKELEFMREQLLVLEEELRRSKKKKPQGFGK